MFMNNNAMAAAFVNAFKCVTENQASNPFSSHVSAIRTNQLTGLSEADSKGEQLGNFIHISLYL
jgi:hypothetical protein